MRGKSGKAATEMGSTEFFLHMVAPPPKRYLCMQTIPPSCAGLQLVNISQYYLRTCSHGGGGPREGEVPRLGGVNNLSIQSLIFLDRVHMKSGVPHRGGLSGQPGRVTRLAGVSFLLVKAEGKVTGLTGVMSIRAFINMAANHYKPGELFGRFHLQNIEKNSFNEENTEEVDGASDNLSSVWSPTMKQNY